MAEKIQKLVDLIAQMTIQEKVGQLNFPVGDLFNTGPTMETTQSDKFDDQIREGKITGLFNIYGASYTHRLQKIAQEESRLGIPLLMGADVIHGLKTIFPIPLAEAASWDLELIKRTARIAAIESTAVGINFNFAPMCDIGLDARWGRVAEGAGEDPYLAGLISAARVRGFQGESLSNADTLAACVKHIAAYGAPEGGRDYNSVDISERRLRETYLPSYKMAIDAGAATVMTSFNDLNGVPCTGNAFLLRDILRKEWGFEGMVVSDWASISEMAVHGTASDHSDAAKQALLAGTDMDMMADAYLNFLPTLIASGEISEDLVNESVYNVLKLKHDLGLFDNAYLYSDEEVEGKMVFTPAHREVSREMAEKSIVLLKNDNQLLPLKSTQQKIALIGPLANNRSDMNGTWSFFADANAPITILEGLQSASENEIEYAEGCTLYSSSEEHFAQAIAAAKNADVVVLALGESAVMNGEAASRTDIGLPDNQLELVKQIKKLGKPIVVLLSCGRPMAIPWLAENVEAILVTWALGTEAGNAIANVVYGNVNPSAKLPITFPRNVGQVPIHYQMKNTGRPYLGDNKESAAERIYSSKYRDVQNSPQFPFGFGLSYTRFEYGELTALSTVISNDERLEVSLTVANVGDCDGEEIVQCYVHDLVASVTRPVLQLKKFEKILLIPGESKIVTFEICKTDLALVNGDMQWVTEPGDFHVFVGPNTVDLQSLKFKYQIN
ncbi:MAG: beta-glucosidase [Roseivirga sp.]|jgi:beta-glucosidase